MVACGLGEIILTVTEVQTLLTLSIDLLPYRLVVAGITIYTVMGITNI
jgi:hypothetical protein